MGAHFSEEKTGLAKERKMSKAAQGRIRTRGLRVHTVVGGSEPPTVAGK